MKQPIKIILLIGVLLLIMYLTLQTPKQTWALTYKAQNFILRLFPDGTAPKWISDGKQFRHFAHIPEYFLLGLVLCSVFSDHRNGLLLALALGLLIGLCDECLKIALPTREFSLSDFTFDAIGLALAAVIYELSTLWRK